MSRRDEGWFNALYGDHYADIVRYGMRRLADPEAASELAQEVFVVAWRRRGDVPEPGLPWLYGVARRVLANQWRAQRTRPAPLPITAADGLPEPGDQNTRAGLLDIRSALATLAPGDQEVLRLTGWEQLTLTEMATVLGCTRPTAAVRLHRARKRLAAALAGASTVSTDNAKGTRHERTGTTAAATR